MSNVIISADRSESSPAEPITLTEVKGHLIITSTDDDTLLNSLITQARKAIENYCHISIARQQITTILIFDDELELPYGPMTDLISVETASVTQGSGPVTYETDTNNWNTDGSRYQTFAGTPGLRYRLIYMAGYDSCPSDLKLAILNEIAFRYENRGESMDTFKANVGLCEASRVLAEPYKRYLWL